MTRTQKRRAIKARQERNQRLMWALQDALGLAMIGCIAYGVGLLAWGLL